MATIKYTPFSDVYANFLSKITDDMYMELTPEDTYKILRELLLAALPKFQFPRQSLDYEEIEVQTDQNQDFQTQWVFINKLTNEQINIITSYMIVEWIGQQLASVENVRMKYSGSDFKFTSQANHMQKLLQLKKDYEREGFHLQRLYKRRAKDSNGVYKSTLGTVMSTRPAWYRGVELSTDRVFNDSRSIIINNTIINNYDGDDDNLSISEQNT